MKSKVKQRLVYVIYKTYFTSNEKLETL